MSQNIPKDVKSIFDSYPLAAGKRLMQVRQLILKCASQDDAIGELTETLKWGEPAYLTAQTGSGSTIRLGFKDKLPDSVAVYFNCQTTIVNEIQQRYPNKFKCENNRALLLPVNKPIPKKELSECLNIALKYHLNRKARESGLL